MTRFLTRSLMLGAMLLPGALVRGADQPKSPDAATPPATTKPAGTVGADVKGRLPPFFSKIVTGDEREKIYKIEAEYAPQIGALEKQIQELRVKRDAEMKAVLTPEQQKQLEEAIAAAGPKHRTRPTVGKKPTTEPAPDATKPVATAPAGNANPTTPPATK